MPFPTLRKTWSCFTVPLWEIVPFRLKKDLSLKMVLKYNSTFYKDSTLFVENGMTFKKGTVLIILVEFILVPL